MNQILNPDLTVAESLKASAAELRRQAARLQRRAQILEEAALTEECAKVDTPDEATSAEAQHEYA